MIIRTRAATPATVFLLAAFVLLLIACLSVPITKSIALGSFNGVSFGVFGWCVNNQCSSIQVGYNPDQAKADSSSSPPSRRFLYSREDGPNNFILSSSARTGLSNMLIVHVIAAALTLIGFFLSIIAHIRVPSHSARFLLAIFALMFLTTILTLLAFMVDLLAFVPHFASGTWLVLAATICNAFATILLCCGRRTLIARKTMRRRIDENAEMSGRNYFREDATKEQALRNSNQNKIPKYAEFEVSKPLSPDRLPLNPSVSQLTNNSTDRVGSDRSNETTSADGSSQRSYRAAVPVGPSPLSGGGYPPPARVARPHDTVSPLRIPSDQQYPPTPDVGHRSSPPQSNVSLNSSNRPPPSNYESPMRPPVVNINRPASSVYSDYVTPRQQWGSSSSDSRTLNDDRSDSRNRYRPQRPEMNKYNLDRKDLMVENSNTAIPRIPEVDPVPATNDAPNQSYRSSDTGTMIASYYEDVDPRFDDSREDELDPTNVYRPPLPHQRIHNRLSRPEDINDEIRTVSPLRINTSYNAVDQESHVNGDEDGRSNPRSPTASTSSHFTSVSQRGVNPRWQPQPPQFVGGSTGSGAYPHRNYRKKNDQMNFLVGNPDFELPMTRSGKRVGATLTVPVDGGGRYPLKI